MAYFGEEFGETDCGNCDVCTEPKERFDGTVAAQKILSCVYRTGERFGIHYVIDVLQGSKSQKIAQNRHDTIKTYGVGKEYSKLQWQAFIRELIQLGYVRLDGDRYPVLKLNEKSHGVLLRNEKVFLTKPQEPEEATRISTREMAEDFDRTLFERLRALRKTIADQEGVPPYVIFHDTSLKEMSVHYPQSLLALSRISGIGDQKLEKYGKMFLMEIIDYCKQHNIGTVQIAQKRPDPPVKHLKSSTVQMTLELYRQHLTIQEIAQKEAWRYLLSPLTLKNSFWRVRI